MRRVRGARGGASTVVMGRPDGLSMVALAEFSLFLVSMYVSLWYSLYLPRRVVGSSAKNVVALAVVDTDKEMV